MNAIRIEISIDGTPTTVIARYKVTPGGNVSFTSITDLNKNSVWGQLNGANMREIREAIQKTNRY